MANGSAWRAVKSEGARDPVFGDQLLGGYAKLGDAGNAPAVHKVKIDHAGNYRLSARVYRAREEQSSHYVIGVRQNGKLVAQQTIEDGDLGLIKRYRLTWTWASLLAPLQPGEAELTVSREDAASSGESRRIDMFVLTDLPDYQPQDADFRPVGYARFTNTAADPYCWFGFVRRFGLPSYAVPGMLSAAGLSDGSKVPTDRDKWLQPGVPSPWVPISKYLMPRGRRNLVSFTATQNRHTEGFYPTPRGKWEFAVGPDHRVVKTIEVDQNAARLRLSLPDDFLNESADILTAFDFIEQKEKVLAQVPDANRPRARHLNLNFGVVFDAELDDPKVIDRELEIIKKLGANTTHYQLADPKNATQFYQKHGLKPAFSSGSRSLLFRAKDKCQNEPDVEAIEKLVRAQAQENAPILDQYRGFIVADEPSAMSYEHIVSHDVCRAKFVAGLRAAGYTPQQLGVATWLQVRPVLPADKDKFPQLWYHTAMFRLQSFADLCVTVVAIKNKVYPVTARAYVDYVPSITSWLQYGADPFLVQRDGGLELGWSEDWLNFGASPQHVSSWMAMLRAAGKDEQPLGGFVVGKSGGARLYRLKFFTMLAAGATSINTYNYGPFYAGIDSWSDQLDLFPVVSAAQHDAAAIDETLYNTKRHPTQIAIVYNRSASIWEEGKFASEIDAQLTHWALSHAGYDADFVAEEDIEAGILNRYKTLYLGGAQLRTPVAQKIDDWVRGGGTLFGAAGAGARDQNIISPRMFWKKSSGYAAWVTTSKTPPVAPNTKSGRSRLSTLWRQQQPRRENR